MGQHSLVQLPCVSDLTSKPESRRTRLELETELRGQHHLVADRLAGSRSCGARPGWALASGSWSWAPRSAFNNLMAATAGLAIATSPATMAYLTTETGVVTMIIIVLVAGYLLTRRATDFARAEPKSPLPTNEPRPDERRARPNEPR